MNSKLYIGEVMHARLTPVAHRFRYPVYFYSFDLDELPRLSSRLRLFGYNRLRLVSLRDADYLDAGNTPIRDKLFRLLNRHGFADQIASVELVTSARFLNYVFNPVSFFLCRRADGSLRCAVAEVHNTFGEKHLYLLDSPLGGTPGQPAIYLQDKEFHVSPFHDMRGKYAFKIQADNGSLDIRINLMKEQKEVFLSRIQGTAVPLTDGRLLKTIGRYPFSALLTIPRILAQSARLYFGRRLRVYSKPEPSSPRTRRYRPPSWRDRFCMKLVFRQIRKWKVEGLAMELPDGSPAFPSEHSLHPASRLRVKNHRFFRRLVREGDVGFGDSYMFGEWESDDLAGLLTRLARTTRMDDHDPSAMTRSGRLVNRIRHRRRANTRWGSRRNIPAHYDLGNDFYRLFLDSTMMYSCGWYRDGSESLEQAQRNKIQRILDKARLAPGDHLLEIGCGWGALAIEAVRRTGCRVTALTLSPAQQQWAEERIRETGFADRITVRLQDYRDLDGRYDAIVSVEMMEAVGHDHLGHFFAVCERVLQPGGRLVVQVITIPDSRYPRYRRESDWIQRRIFPGGHLPSLGALRQALSESSRLRIEHRENIGPHYAPTLRDWRRRFLEHQAGVRALGFDDRFIRMWDYYLAYCEAGFATGLIHDQQLVINRAEASSPPWPGRTAPMASRAKDYGNLTPVR